MKEGIKMYNAISKINEEMQKEPSNKYLEIIGHYIIDRCSEEAVAKAVNNPEKSLNGAYEHIEIAARKKASKHCAVMTDSEIFDAIDEYFGISANSGARAHTKGEVDGVPSLSETVENNSKSVNLDFDSFFA